MGEKSDFLLEAVEKNHIYFLKTQKKNGAWNDGDQPCIHAILTAISALLDHSFVTQGNKRFVKEPSYKKWRKRMNEDGLFLNAKKFQIVHENDEKIRNLVFLNLKENGLTLL